MTMPPRNKENGDGLHKMHATHCTEASTIDEATDAVFTVALTVTVTVTLPLKVTVPQTQPPQVTGYDVWGRQGKLSRSVGVTSKLFDVVMPKVRSPLTCP